MLKHVNALIFLVFIQGSYARNVKCTNDFDRLMTCIFTPDHRPTYCSEYSVEVEFYPADANLMRSYNCDLTFVDGQCHCTIDVADAGFLVGENPTVILKRNGQINDSFIIVTAEHIKPKTPTIISVNQTSDGNLNVTWLTHYKKLELSDQWKTELKYRRKQLKNESWVRVEENAIHKTHYVFISNNLDRDAEYVVKARVCIAFDNQSHFSEWSEEFTFHSGTSVESVVMKVVPVICLILVLIVCTLTCCYVKIKKTWIKNTDIFPPKIEALDNAEYMILCPEKTLVSRMVVHLLKEHIREEEKGITTLSVSDSSGNSGQTENSNSTSISVDYGLTCHVEKDPVQNHVLERLLSAVHEDLERERQIQSAPKMKPFLPGLSDYESVDMHKPKNACGASSAPQSNSGCTSASSFDNQCYSVPTSPSPCNSSFFAPSLSCDLGYQSSESFDQPMSVETDGWNVILPPLVQTELAYQPCNGSPNSESECPPLSENMEANRTFVSEPKEQEVGKDLFETCPLPLGLWSPLISDDEYRSVQSLIPS